MRLFVLLLYAIFLVVDYVHFTFMLTGYRLYIQSSNLPLMRLFFFFFKSYYAICNAIILLLSSRVY